MQSIVFLYSRSFMLNEVKIPTLWPKRHKQREMGLAPRIMVCDLIATSITLRIHRISRKIWRTIPPGAQVVTKYSFPGAIPTNMFCLNFPSSGSKPRDTIVLWYHNLNAMLFDICCSTLAHIYLSYYEPRNLQQVECIFDISSGTEESKRTRSTQPGKNTKITL